MRRFTSLLRFCFGFFGLAVGSLLVIAALIPLLPWRVARIFVCNFYGKTVGRFVVFAAGATPNVLHGERLDGSMPAIYVANHASTIDAFLCIWLCPYGGCGVLKKEIVRIPFYGQLALLSGNLLIDRTAKDKAVEALKETAAFVKEKKLGMWIMPEGTRSRDGALLPFKRGFVHLAIATGLPVVPVVIHGAHKAWEAKTFTFNPMTIDVEVLPPIDTSTWTESTAGEHADAVRGAFAQALAARSVESPQVDAPALPVPGV
ncbi:MAG: 1-acyl-sn-glycerol-3-phosphate acyltransferase [Archangium sp.]|nr:1-acyl-sn-glycerol-3-phosphate acyltransferase [Archangium sp.]